MIEHLLLQYGYLIIFFGTMVEADATLLPAAFLAHSGYFKIPLVILTAVISSAIVSQIVFFLARGTGRAAFERKAATDPKWRKLRDSIQTRGPWLLLVSRFMLGLRTAINGACAASGMNVAFFLFMDFTGSVIWGLTMGLSGYYFGHAVTHFLNDIRKHEKWIALGIFTILALVLWRWQKREIVETVDAISHPAEHSVHSVEEVGAKLESRLTAKNPSSKSHSAD